MENKCETKCKSGCSLPYEPKADQEFNFKPDIIRVSCETVMNQTEQAVNDLGGLIKEVDIKATEAGELAGQAMTAANEARDEAFKGQEMAQEVLDKIVEVRQDLADTDALASQAMNRADDAFAIGTEAGNQAQTALDQLVDVRQNLTATDATAIQALNKANDAFDKVGDVDAKADNIQAGLNTHMADKSNPHEVTAEQIGAYTKTEVAELISAHNNAIADDSLHSELQEKFHAVVENLRVRKRLILNTTYYVDPVNGHDSNDGLTSGTAFRSMNALGDLLSKTDGGTYDLTLSLAPGNYSGLPLQFNTNIQKHLIIVGTEPEGIIKLSNTLAIYNSRVQFKDINIEITSGYWVHMYIAESNVQFERGARISFSGSSASAMNIFDSVAIFFDGSDLFFNDYTAMSSVVNVNTRSYLRLDPSMNVSGTATGRRFNVNTLAGINTNGRGANFFPGTSEGTVHTLSGGFYS